MAGVALFPSDTLSFTLNANDASQASLTIKNKDVNTHVMFKVKTTRPLRYLVRPNQGVIGPLQSATVMVILQSKDCGELLNMAVNERQLSNDKFLVQSATVDEAFSTLLTTIPSKEQTEALNEKWTLVAKKDIVNKKLRCEFKGEEVVGGAEGQERDTTTTDMETTNNASEASASLSSELLGAVETAPAGTASEKQKQFTEVATLRKKYDEVRIRMM